MLATRPAAALLTLTLSAREMMEPASATTYAASLGTAVVTSRRPVQGSRAHVLGRATRSAASQEIALVVSGIASVTRLAGTGQTAVPTLLQHAVS